MTGRLRSALRALTSPIRRVARWWNGLEPAERVLYRAAGLLAIGCALVWTPAAFIVPGLLFALVFFGFNLRRAA